MGSSEAGSPPCSHYTSDSGKSLPAVFGFLTWKQKHLDPPRDPLEKAPVVHKYIQDEPLHGRSTRGCSHGVRAAGPQGPRWGHVPPRKGLGLLPRGLMKAGAVFLAAQWHHVGLSGGISISITAIRYWPWGALTSPERLQTWTIPS